MKKPKKKTLGVGFRRVSSRAEEARILGALDATIKSLTKRIDALESPPENCEPITFERGAQMAHDEIVKRADRIKVGVSADSPEWTIAAIKEAEARRCASILKSYCNWIV